VKYFLWNVKKGRCALAAALAIQNNAGAAVDGDDLPALF